MLKSLKWLKTELQTFFYLQFSFNIWWEDNKDELQLVTWKIKMRLFFSFLSVQSKGTTTGRPAQSTSAQKVHQSRTRNTETCWGTSGRGANLWATWRKLWRKETTVRRTVDCQVHTHTHTHAHREHISIPASLQSRLLRLLCVASCSTVCMFFHINYVLMFVFYTIHQLEHTCTLHHRLYMRISGQK